ncbi:diguanylate cyclase [Bradyrhizobium rifense]|uniref:diguanylate cyclase n=1 Tax=Bradyrhizobium rifense TaxID=515499 RepID=A0A5D3K3N2_9BRAD|nr:diguanylate cyclase [Bradyrhizobium rifense]TYL82179.1 diguanylate cyclase [Bradyrhizobium rifense]
MIVVLLAFTLASFWALIAWKGMQERALAFAKAGSETQGLTHSLAQHASKSFNAVALALFGAGQYILHSDKSARASAEINDLLAQYAKNIPQVREIGVLAENGDWMFSSFETVPAVNNGDRDYFRYHRDHPEDETPRISEPLTSRVTGRPTLLMTQRLSNPDGSFGGVIFAAIDLAYFRSFYAEFEADLNRTVTLMKTNGKVLVHRRDDQVGKDMTGTALFSGRLKDAGTGLYSIVSPFDGRTKQFAYERLSDFPIVISVAVAEDTILDGWRGDRRFDLLLGAAISTILIGLAVVLALQTRKRSVMARMLRERERGYRLLAENVEDVVTRIDMDGRRLYVSPSIEKLLGWSADEIIRESAYSNIHPAHRELIKGLIGQLGAQNRTATCEYMTRRRDGNYVWVEAQLNFVQDPDEPTAEIVGAIRDISKRKAAEEQLVAANEQLKALSETDPLTGLANRRRFDRMFDAEFKRCQRSGSQLSVLFIDIDKFKSFNDTYGHSAGDDCIRQVAGALASCLKRPADLVARYGGEEFAVLLPETAAINAEVVAEAARNAVHDLAIQHHGSPDGSVTISVGVAGGKCDARNSTSSMLAAADGALYLAKEQGRNRVCVAAENPSLTLVRPAG